MPAPAIYVIAIVGTVGVAIAFKEFIYEPHIAPRIDRWKAEFQAARQRRAESERTAAMAEVALIQRGTGKHGHQNPEDDDHDSDQSAVGLGEGTPTLRVPVQPHMRNGLLTRRRSDHYETTPSKSGDVELDDWTTGTSSATETGCQQSDLRLRKNNGSLNESVQLIPRTHFSRTSPSRTSTSSRASGENSSQTKTGHKPIELELEKTTPKTTETHPFLDESIQAIPYTPLSPIRTPTPTHVLYNPSSARLPSDPSFSTKISLPLPEKALLSELKANVTDSSTSHPLLAPLQLPSPSSCAADMASVSANNAELLPRAPRSPPGLGNIVSQTSNMAVVGVDPLLVNVDSTTTPNGSITPLSPLASLPLPPALAFSPPSQLLSPTRSHTSPYQTPPHVHAIPSLSQSYPLDDLLDYEHGLELLSPPSPLSRINSPFEFGGLSPRPEAGEGSTLLLSRNRRTSGELMSAAPMDSITNSTRSATYLSFPSSPAFSASSISASSENGYENDSSRSEFSSTFSSPMVAPTRLGLGLDLGSESLPPHDQSRPNHSMSPLSSRSSPYIDINYPQRHRRQQQERNVGSTSMRPTVPVPPTPMTTSQESDAQRPMITFNDDDEYDDHVDTQTLSPRDRARSPWTMMNRTATESVATTLISTRVQPMEPAARVTMSDSDFDTRSDLSDLDFLSMSAGEYEAAAPAAAAGGGQGGGSVDLRSHGSGMSRRAGGIGGPGIGDGSESDTSSWSLAGGSE